MKKIVALGCAAALVGGLAFAGEPASNPSVASFNGNASVEWGVDLDAGKTGFKNGVWSEFKMKLFDTGTKETSGDGVWGELKIKIEDDDSVGPNGVNNGTPKWKAAAVDTAKLHFNNIYVGIMSGDTQTGELDFATAVRSGDPWFHPGRWLTNVGSNATEGIVAGYEDGNLNIAVDFRSALDGDNRYTDNYKMAAEIALKDSNEWVEGLAVKAGASYNLSEKTYSAGDVPTGEKDDDGNDINRAEKKVVETEDKTHTLGYSASVAYKLSLDDKYYVKPMVGLTGTYATNSDAKTKANQNDLVVSALFGWGGTNSYGSANGIYYFKEGDDNCVRGVTPGISVLAKIALPATSESEVGGKTTKSTIHYGSKLDMDKPENMDGLVALIVPSFYLGDLLADSVPGLKAAAYAEIGLYQDKKDAKIEDSSVEGWVPAKNADTAIAFVAGLAYDIKSDDLTITPKASIRYANASYMDNKTNSIAPAAGQSPLAMSGVQKKYADGEKAGLYDGDFFNLSAGADVNGLIANTTFYCNYVSANLLNKIEYNEAAGYKDGAYNVKNGTFNVGCQIHF